MSTVKVLPKGQITLPKKVRQKLKIHEGDALVLLQKGDSIILKKGITIFDLKGMLPAHKMPVDKMIEKATLEAVKERV